MNKEPEKMKNVKSKSIIVRKTKNQPKLEKLSESKNQKSEKSSSLKPETVIVKESSRNTEKSNLTTNSGLKAIKESEFVNKEKLKDIEPKDELRDPPTKVVESNKNQSPQRINRTSHHEKVVFNKRFGSTLRSRIKKNKKEFDTRLITSSMNNKMTPQRSIHFMSKSPNRGNREDDLRMPFLSKAAKEMFEKRERKWNRNHGITVSKNNEMLHPDHKEYFDRPMLYSRKGISHFELPKAMMVYEKDDGSPIKTNIIASRK